MTEKTSNICHFPLDKSNRSGYSSQQSDAFGIRQWLARASDKTLTEVEEMLANGNREAAIETLRTRLAAVEEEARALRISIRSLEDDNATKDIVPLPEGSEYATANMIDAITIILRKAKKPLHVTTLAKALKEGGFRFRTKHPKKTIPGVIYGAIKKGNTEVKAIGKNNFSLSAIEGVKKSA